MKVFVEIAQAMFRAAIRLKSGSPVSADSDTLRVIEDWRCGR